MKKRIKLVVDQGALIATTIINLISALNPVYYQ